MLLGNKNGPFHFSLNRWWYEAKKKVSSEPTLAKIVYQLYFNQYHNTYLFFFCNTLKQTSQNIVK